MFFFIHLQASDTAAHHLWHTYFKESPRHQAAQASDLLAQVYSRLDLLVGRLVQAADPTTRVLVVSDHGMVGASDCAVYLNRWLSDLGVLQLTSSRAHSLKRQVARGLRGILAALPAGGVGVLQHVLPLPWQAQALSLSRAQAVDYSQSAVFSDELDYAPSLWINRTDVFAQGTVAPQDVAALTDRLASAAQSLRCPVRQTPLVAKIHRRDQLPPGPYLERFPDLLLEPALLGGHRPSFLSSDGPGPVVVRRPPEACNGRKGQGMPGVHRRRGIAWLSGPGVPARPMPVLKIAEAGALVYALMGLEAPRGAGCVALPEWLAAWLEPSTACLPSAEPAQEPEVYGKAGRLAVAQRLRDMGYLD